MDLRMWKDTWSTDLKDAQRVMVNCFMDVKELLKCLDMLRMVLLWWAKDVQDNYKDHNLWNVKDVQVNSLPTNEDICPLLVTFVNSLDLDQVSQNVGPDLGPNCWTLCWYYLKILFLKKKRRKTQ